MAESRLGFSVEKLEMVAVGGGLDLTSNGLCGSPPPTDTASACLRLPLDPRLLPLWAGEWPDLCPGDRGMAESRLGFSVEKLEMVAVGGGLDLTSNGLCGSPTQEED